MKKLILLISLLLIGCSAQYTCPTITCPSYEEEPIIEEETSNIIVIDAGTEVYLEVRDNYIDITNCGKTAYGLVVIDSINKQNKKVRYLTINNTESSYIGGCRDILIEFPEIEKVYIKDIERDTEEYRELIRWVPSNKIEKLI
jgi:uncharacterized protein YcfL